MNITPLDPLFSVSGQIAIGDIAEVAARGFTTLVNNRPDGEAADQPASAEIEAEAHRRGLGYTYIPVTPGKVDETAVRRLAETMSGAAGPILAYCRSGARSTQLWKAAQALGAAGAR